MKQGCFKPVSSADSRGAISRTHSNSRQQGCCKNNLGLDDSRGAIIQAQTKTEKKRPDAKEPTHSHKAAGGFSERN